LNLIKNNNDIKWIIRINLLIGMYNLYLWVEGNVLFNLLIGSLNVGVWVFYRNYDKSK